MKLLQIFLLISYIYQLLCVKLQLKDARTCICFKHESSIGCKFERREKCDWHNGNCFPQSHIPKAIHEIFLQTDMNKVILSKK